MEFWRARHAVAPKEAQCYLWSSLEEDDSDDDIGSEAFGDLVISLVRLFL